MLILLFNFAKGGQQPQADEKLLLEKIFIGNKRYYATMAPVGRLRTGHFSSSPTPALQAPFTCFLNLSYY